VNLPARVVDGDVVLVGPDAQRVRTVVEQRVLGRVVHNPPAADNEPTELRGQRCPRDWAHRALICCHFCVVCCRKLTRPHHFGEEEAYEDSYQCLFAQFGKFNITLIIDIIGLFCNVVL